MLKRIYFVAVPALAMLLGSVSLAQAAAVSCGVSLTEVQAKWDKMYPMGMGRPGGSGYQSVIDSFRIAKEKCAKGDAESEHYLNIVRAHLGMPEMPTGHAPQEKPREALYSEGLSDALANPVYGGQADLTGRDIRPEGASAPNIGK